MNNKILFSGSILLTVSLLVFGYFYLNKFEKTSQLTPSFSGDWSYFEKDATGYSTGFDLNLTRNGNKISGEFSGVWNFPKSEAARINTGIISGTIRTNNTEADISWTGDRGETGTATISVLPEKSTEMLWKRNSITGGDEFTFGEEMIFWRKK